MARRKLVIAGCQAPLIHQRGAKITMRYSAVGVQLQSPSASAHGILQLALIFERIAEIVMCFGKSRLDGKCLLTAGHCII